MTTSNPPDMPSSRPMTLRQQLLDIDKLRQTHQIDNPEYIDRLVEVCQEIAREATLDTLLTIVGDAVEKRTSVSIELADKVAELTQKPPQPLADTQDAEEAQSE